MRKSQQDVLSSSAHGLYGGSKQTPSERFGRLMEEVGVDYLHIPDLASGKGAGQFSDNGLDFGEFGHVLVWDVGIVAPPYYHSDLWRTSR